MNKRNGSSHCAMCEVTRISRLRFVAACIYAHTGSNQVLTASLLYLYSHTSAMKQCPSIVVKRNRCPFDDVDTHPFMDSYERCCFSKADNYKLAGKDPILTVNWRSRLSILVNSLNRLQWNELPAQN